MRSWKMTAADFYDLLKRQDHRCCLSGKILTPETVRIVKISPEVKTSKSNVCLVHEILAPLARKWSITDVRMICIQIANFSEAKTVPDPDVPKIRSKSNWHLTLDRISNFNQKKGKARTTKAIKSWTWGERGSEQIRNMNRSG
jgi:hypothetical protein